MEIRTNRKRFLIELFIILFILICSTIRAAAFVGLHKTMNIELREIPNSTATIYTSHDSTGQLVSGWSPMLYSGDYPGSITVQNLNLSTKKIVMNSAGISKSTPYCKVVTSRVGYRPTGWIKGAVVDRGLSMSSGPSVYNQPEKWANGESFFYIGKDFDRASITATWEPYYLTLNYHLNGGTLKSSAKDYFGGILDGEIWYKEKFAYNTTDGDMYDREMVPENAFDLIEKKGYVFDSSGTFNTKEDGSGAELSQLLYPSTFPELLKTLNTDIDKGDRIIDLYPQWEPREITLSYMRDFYEGDTAVSDRQTFKYDASTKVKQVNYRENAGYRLVGWTTARGSGRVDFSAGKVVSNKYILTKSHKTNIKVWPVWELNVGCSLDGETLYYHVGDDVTLKQVAENAGVILYDRNTFADVTDLLTSEYNVVIPMISDVKNSNINLNEANPMSLNLKIDTSKKRRYVAEVMLNIQGQRAKEKYMNVVIVNDLEDAEVTRPVSSSIDGAVKLPNGELSNGEFTPSPIEADIRYISEEHLDTLDSASKWNTDSALNTELTTSLNKKATDDNSLYVIELSKDDCDDIKAYICNGKTWDNSLNKEILTKYSHIFTKK